MRDALTQSRTLFLGTGLAGSLLIGLAAQLPAADVADIQGGLFSTPDETSWILTVYTMASFAGIVTSGPFIKFLGVGRYLTVTSTTFAITALACATAPDIRVVIALRLLQGFVAGGFGPAAFFVVFTAMGGPRLPFGVTLLAFVLLFPSSAGPVVAGFAEDSLGWQMLFLIQAGFGMTLALAAWAWVPRQDSVDRSALKTDWLAVTMLSVGLAAMMLVFSQGTRRFWFENEIIFWSTAISVAAWAGFLFLVCFSPISIISPRLLASRKLGVPIALNLIFRVGLVVTAYLIPQFLSVVQGYRPVELAQLFLWAAIPQLAALPVVWWLMRRLDMRVVMGLGLALCATGTALVVDGTALVAAEQMRATLAIFALGQLLFLAPALVIGATSLKPADLPTASLAFNIATLGGTTLGVGLVSQFVTEREKFHSNVITEKISLYSGLDSDRLATLTAALANRLVDDNASTAGAAGLLASIARREAWVLAFNDGFFLIVGVLLIGAMGIFAIGRSPSLRAMNVSRGEAL
ncbi:MFS transporter [Mesorhizobium opportunistum]|uniref:MFS transporter n=1 Tax=Mesorhizobium opportunistum TaxID=593909 RepID=UPI00333BD298